MTDQTNPTTEPPKGRPKNPASLRGLLDAAIEEAEQMRAESGSTGYNLANSVHRLCHLLKQARKKVR